MRDLFEHDVRGTVHFEIRNPKFDVAEFPRHDRFAPLLYRVVACGLWLGAVVLLVKASGVPDGRPLLTGTAAAAALTAVAFALRQVLVACRPWRRLAATFGVAIVCALVLQLALRTAAALGAGIPPLSSLVLQLASFAYGVLAAGLLLAYLSHRLNEIYGLFGALLFLSTPPLLLPATMGSLSLGFYASAALLCIFLWGETAGLSWLIAAGLGMGFAAAGLSWKPALFVLACGLVVTLAVARGDRGWQAKLVSALVLLSCSIAPYASWEVIAWIWGSEGAWAHARAGYAIGAGPSPDGIGATLWQGILHSIVALPLGEARLPHALIVGPAAVCFLPWAFQGKWSVEKRVLLLAALAFLLAGGHGGALKSLGLLPIIPLLATLAAYGVHNLYMSVRRPAWLFATAGILLAWDGLIVWSIIA